MSADKKEGGGLAARELLSRRRAVARPGGMREALAGPRGPQVRCASRPRDHGRAGHALAGWPAQGCGSR